MKQLSIGSMLLALIKLSNELPPYQQSFIQLAADRSNQGSDTSRLSDKEVEFIHMTYIETCT